MSVSIAKRQRDTTHAQRDRSPFPEPFATPKNTLTQGTGHTVQTLAIALDREDDKLEMAGRKDCRQEQHCDRHRQTHVP